MLIGLNDFISWRPEGVTVRWLAGRAKTSTPMYSTSSTASSSSAARQADLQETRQGEPGRR